MNFAVGLTKLKNWIFPSTIWNWRKKPSLLANSVSLVVISIFIEYRTIEGSSLCCVCVCIFFIMNLWRDLFYVQQNYIMISMLTAKAGIKWIPSNIKKGWKKMVYALRQLVTDYFRNFVDSLGSACCFFFGAFQNTPNWFIKLGYTQKKNPK